MTLIRNIATELIDFTKVSKVAGVDQSGTPVDVYIDVTKLGTFAAAIAASDIESDLETGTDKAIFFMPFDMDVFELVAGVGTAPTGSSLIIDYNKNAVSIGTVTISAAANTGNNILGAHVSFVQGDKVTIDIDQRGAIIAGKALTIYMKGYLK